MTADDFRSNERSAVIDEAGALRIEHVDTDGAITVLQAVGAGSRRRGGRRNVDARRRPADLPRRPDRRATGRGRALLGPPQGDDDEGLRPDHLRPCRPGLLPGAVRSSSAVSSTQPTSTPTTVSATSSPSSATLPEAPAIEAVIEAGLAAGPSSGDGRLVRGITNLHVPCDVIVDASMPAMIRTSGQMWDAGRATRTHLAVIPDSCYAGIYQVVIDDCRANGAYDPATMGSVPNVGLMAQAAEEYGSHDKTFEIAADGTVRVVDGSRTTGVRAHRRRRRHLADVQDQGRPGPATGSSSPSPAPGRPARRPCSGSMTAGRTTPT